MLSLILIILLPILVIFVLYKIFLRTKVQDRIELWYQCCQALNIEREEMAKVVGKSAMSEFEKKFFS
jgi:septation ring formation regulator EzrA